MSFTNENTKEINCKVVYFGPPLAGKSTTLRHLYGEIKKGAKGKMISLSEDKDHTLYFDFVPFNLGKIGDYTVRLHLYTVPGEVGYEQSRALISKGVDGVVFVADSGLARMDANIESLRNLKKILAQEGQEWSATPCVFQYNKRDLPGAIPSRELARFLNEDGRKDFETVATKGTGVFEAFKAISAQVLTELGKEAL